MTARVYQRHQAYDMEKTRNAPFVEELFDWLLEWEKDKPDYLTPREYMRRGVTIFNGDNNTSFFMDDALDRFEEWKETNDA